MSERHDLTTRPFSTEEPLLVLPTLALAVGLHQAIILQYLHGMSGGQPEAQAKPPWIPLTETMLARAFPFWDAATLHQIIDHLLLRGVLETEQPFRATPATWYRLNYDQIQAVLDAHTAEGQR
jgi:hypothetical protein